MSKKCLTFLMLILVTYVSHGSEIAFNQKEVNSVDSLMQVVKTAKEDTSKVNTLNLLSKSLWQKGDLDKAMGYAANALTLSKNTGFNKGIVNSYNNIGVILREQGNHADALKNLLVALKKAEAIRFKKGIAESYNNIGGIYHAEGNFPEAIKNHLAALKIAEEINNKHIIASSYGNLGNIYSSENNFSDALKNYLAALKIYEKLNDRRGITISSINIGQLYISKNNFSKAKEYLNKSLLMSKETNNKAGIVVAYINLGAICIQLKKPDEGKEYFTKGLQLAKEVKSKDFIRRIYLGFSKIDSINGDFKGAYYYYKLFYRMTDSIFNETSSKQISQMKILYETEKKDKEIELNNIRIHNQRATIWYMVGGFCLLIIFALIYLFLYNQKRKSTFRHKVLETEMKALRSQMNPHFTFNVLNSIQYFISENDMDSAELYIEKFSSLIRMILDQSRTSYITLEQEITILKLYLELEEMRFEKKFNYTLNIDNNLDPGKILIPGMLVQPIVENAIKHGIRYKEGDAQINIRFSSKDSLLICNVTDNGIGLAESKKLNTGNPYKSTATSIIKERIEALSSIYKIKLTYKTEDLFNSEGKPEGISVTIEIPIGIKEEEI